MGRVARDRHSIVERWRAETKCPGRAAAPASTAALARMLLQVAVMPPVGPPVSRPSRPSSPRRAVARAAGIAAIVGTTLVAINHGDHLRREPCCRGFFWKLALSYAVPFVVSLISTRLALADARRAAG